MLTDAEIVSRIRRWLAGGITDHMLGCRVRLLIEDRAEPGARADGRPYDPRD